MKKWKLYHFGLLIIACILINHFGALLTANVDIPFWLDAIGTLFSSYVAGPLVGSMVGVTGNLTFSMATGELPIYALTSIVLAFVTGYCARKKMLNSFFGSLTASILTTGASLLVSFPLNLIFNGGRTGNVWGNGVIDRLTEVGSPVLFAQFAGQFYIEFTDKLLSVLLLYLFIRIVWKNSDETEEQDAGAGEGAVNVILPFLVMMFLSFRFSPVTAQNIVPVSGSNYSNYVQTVYSSENGLPSGEANDIAQTNDGILWIGTYAGLFRYNGSEFRFMDDYDSVHNVNCLYVDPEGRLWIGTNDNGLSIAINESIINVIDKSSGLPSNSVRSIIQGADGFYYIGTSGSLQVLSLNNGLKTVSTLWEINYADGIAADEKGNVVAASHDGRLFLLRAGRILSSRQLTDEKNVFTSCTFSPSGALLAGTSNGRIFIFDISKDNFDELTVLATEGLRNLKDLHYLENGDLFVTADNGIGYFDIYGTFRVINTNEFSDSIDKMLIDYQGNLWFTSSRLGLLRLATSSFLNIYSTIGMSHHVVNAIVFWNDHYYIGTDKGLDIINEEMTEQVKNNLTRELSGTRIRCMLVDSKNSLWICTYGSGLIEIEADGTRHVYTSKDALFGNRVRVAFELSDGTILVGSDKGISFIRDHQVDEKLTASMESINSMILTATELPDGRIVVGTDGGGLAVIENYKVTRILTREDGLNSEVILRTVYDEKGNGLFIINSNGICYMEIGGSIRALKNFPYYNNYDIFIENESDRLFVMSSAGIYVAKREDVLADQPDLQYELLDSRRGLDSSLTANSWYYSNESGELFLPCDSGVYMINTQTYANSAQIFRMSLASILLDGEETRTDRDNTITVPRSVTRLDIVPEIINYSVQVPYIGYYLEGLEPDWQIMPLDALKAANYPNLPVGKYTFRLAVFDANQQEILIQRNYPVVKEKEIYDYSWFLIYMVTIPVMVAIWLTTYISMKRNERIMERQAAALALSQQQVKMSNDTIIAIARAVDAKDERTSQHSWRVSEYSVMIGREMGLGEEDIENLRRAALVHDIGKIGIADAILNKDSRLTDEEYAIMKSHTLRGADILKGLTYIPHVLDGALYHHERIDGRGYPNGLKGEEIPLFARIIGVADAFDAMTANRVYRKQMDLGYVLGEMERGRGTQFDPEADDILIRLLNDGTIDLKKLYPSLGETPAEKKDEGGAA